MNKDVDLWMKQATDDLKTAQSNFRSEIYYAACFFSQQSVEKALKAIYIKEHNELARVHDLVFLSKKVELPSEFLTGCKYLARVYIEARYPSEIQTPSELFTKQDTEKCIEIARGILKWAKTRI
ncbi:HEPN domain-containing protein [Candidatus Micrarchaeota archaeon]|nr:HEPN domain-containing protein [Candidatus Micrarchaeota archaeon]